MMIGLRGYAVYFRYAARHKWMVAKECLKFGLYWRALTHDLSKFLPDEFIAYAQYWVGFGWKYLGDPSAIPPSDLQRRFKKATRLHKRRNRHHPEYWLPGYGRDDGNGVVGEPADMDDDSIIEMLCDWEAVGLMFSGSPGARRWYRIHGEEMSLSPRTRRRLEAILESLEDS